MSIGDDISFDVVGLIYFFLWLSSVSTFEDKRSSILQNLKGKGTDVVLFFLVTLSSSTSALNDLEVLFQL